MHSMLRQNQIKLQDIKAYVRTCDRQSKQGPEVWAQQEANAFAPGTLVFLLEPAKRPPGLTSFAAKSQPGSAGATASDTFRVKDLAVVVDMVEDKAWVLNITPSAYELRFLDTLFKEKATKAILEGIDFNYLIATPRKGLDDGALKEMRQLANLYGSGGSRRSLAQNPSGPDEPARAILGFLGVKWDGGGSGGKPVIELGSVCHLIFAPEGQEENPLRSVIKGCFTPILATEKLSDVSSPAAEAAPEASGAVQVPPKMPSPPEAGFSSLSGIETLDKGQSDSIFAPIGAPSSSSPPPEGDAPAGIFEASDPFNLSGPTGAPPDPFAPIGAQAPEPDMNLQPDLNLQPKLEPMLQTPALESEPELLKEAKEEPTPTPAPTATLASPDAPKAEVPTPAPDEYVPAWYLLTHDLDEMNKVGREKAAARAVPKAPEPKVDYSEQFFSDFEGGHAGTKAIEAAEQKMQDDLDRDIESKYSPASADDAAHYEGFNDSIFAESGAKSSMEINPDAEVVSKSAVEPPKPIEPSQPLPENDLFKPIESPETSGEGNLFEKLTSELAAETPGIQELQQEQTQEPASGQTGAASGPPTNLMDMLTADSDVFTTSSAKTSFPEVNAGQPGAGQDNYDDLADALSGLIDSRSAPSAQPTAAEDEDSSAPAPVSFDMDVPQALTESGSYPPINVNQGNESQQRPSTNLFDDAEEDDFDSEMNEMEEVQTAAYGESHQATGEISKVEIRPELTLTEGRGAEEEAPQEFATEPEPEPALQTEPVEVEAYEQQAIITPPPPPAVEVEAEAAPEPVAETQPEPEPVVTEAPEAPVAEEVEAAPVEREAIITPPPPVLEAAPEPVVETQPEPEPEPEPEPVVTEAPEAPAAEIVETYEQEPAAEIVETYEQEAIITPPPPAVEAETEAAPEPVVTEAPEAPVAHEAIITPPPPHPVDEVVSESAPELAEAPPEEPAEESDVATDGDTTEKKKPIMLGTSRARGPLLRPSGKGIKRTTARPGAFASDASEEPEPAPPEAVELPTETVAAIEEAPASVAPHEVPQEIQIPAEMPPQAEQVISEPEPEPEPAPEAAPQEEQMPAPAPLSQPEPEPEAPVEVQEEIEEEPQPTGPALEPKLVLSESARFMARLNQRLAEADKKLENKAEQAKANANQRLAEHLENCERVEKDRANSSQALAAKHTRQLESIASQVKSRINETAGDAIASLNAVIGQAEQEIDQVKQELISTLRYAEHRARSDSESLQEDAKKGLENHIQERSQEFKERTEYVCGLLEQAANEHIELADKRFEKFKSRMEDELKSIIASLERNVNSMNEEIDGSWERASAKLQSNLKEFENTSNHMVRDCELSMENKVKEVYVEQILPKLIDNKAIFRTMLFDMKKNFEEQSDRTITEHLAGLESNIKNAQEELKLVVSKCHASIDEVGRGQQAGLEELFDHTSARMQEFNHSVKTRLEKARQNLEHNQEACNKIAEYGPENEDTTLSEERTVTRNSIQNVCRDAENSLEQAISSGCDKLERVSDDLQHRLTRQREDWTGKVKLSSDEGLSRVKRAIQDAYQAIEQAKDKHME
ncbi:MAG: hypothetical protein R3D26_07505 [Cyanobacteriota/Melainabacteria group bacterium]